MLLTMSFAARRLQRGRSLAYVAYSPKPTDASTVPRTSATQTLPGGTYTGSYANVHFTGAVDTSGPLTLTDCTVDDGLTVYDGPVVVDHCDINGWMGVTTNNTDANKAVFTMRFSKSTGPTDDDAIRLGNYSPWGDTSFYMNIIIEDSILYSPYAPTPGSHFDLIQTGGAQNAQFTRCVLAYLNQPYDVTATNYMNNGVESPNITFDTCWFEGGPVGYVLAGPMTVSNSIINQSTAYYGYKYDSRSVTVNTTDEFGAPI